MSLVVRTVACLTFLFVVSGNRPPYLHAGRVQNQTLNQSMACVSRALRKHGHVSVSWGTMPEDGDARVHLWTRVRAQGSAPDVAVSLEAGPGFTAIGLDARSRQLGDTVWVAITSTCGVVD